MPLIPILWIGGLLAGGYALAQGGKVLGEANQTARLAMIGGGVYVAYRVAKTAGAIK